MFHVNTDGMSTGYASLVQRVVLEGDVVAPRGQRIAEVRPLALTLRDISRPAVNRPGMNKGLMWAEILMVLAGSYEGWLYDLVAPESTRNLFTEHGAYGPRVRQQLQEVVEELEHDRDSRRAVVYIPTHTDLAVVDDTLDMPCTTSWQFMVRNGKLETFVTMRSWDLFWGLTYDLPVFTTVARVLAASLDVDYGPYYHVAASGHVYERHWKDVAGMSPSTNGDHLPDVGLRLFTSPSHNLHEVQGRALTTLETLQNGHRHGHVYTSNVFTEWWPAVVSIAQRAGIEVRYE